MSRSTKSKGKQAAGAGTQTDVDFDRGLIGKEGTSLGEASDSGSPPARPRSRRNRSTAKKSYVVQDVESDDEAGSSSGEAEATTSEESEADSDDLPIALSRRPPAKRVAGSRVASPRPKKRTRREKEELAVLQEEDDTLDCYDEVPLECTYEQTDVEIETNPKYRNLRKVKNWLDEAQRINKYTPQNENAVATSIASWMNQPVASGRSHRCAEVTNRVGNHGAPRKWQVMIVNTGRNGAFDSRKLFMLPRAPTFQGNSAQQRVRARRIGEELAVILDHLPVPLPSGISTMSTALARLACTRAYPAENRLMLHPIKLLHQKEGHSYLAGCFFYDLERGEYVKENIPVHPRSLRGVDPVDVPDVTHAFTFVDGERYEAIQLEDRDGQRVLPRLLPDDDKLVGVTDRRAHDCAEKLARWLVSIVQDTITTLKQVRKLAALYKRMVTGNAVTRHGIYDGYPLLVIGTHPTNRRITIKASTHFQRNFSTQVPEINILGTVAAIAAASVMEAALTEFTLTSDERLALKAAAVEADRINSDKKALEELHDRCDCTDSMRLTELHCCQRCLKPTVCRTRTLSLISGLWLCSICTHRQTLDLRTNNTSITTQLLTYNLSRRLKSEARALNQDFDSKEYQDSTFKPALAKVLSSDLSQGADQLAYKNAYTGKTMTYVLTASPNTPSVEAVFPKYRIVSKGVQRYERHSPENLEVIDVGTNRLKYTALPAFLPAVSAFLNSTSPDSVKKRVLLDKCNKMAAVRSKTPLWVKDLTSLPIISDAQWETDLAEMINAGEQGPPIDPGGMFRTYGEAYRSHWTIDDKRDMVRVLKQICARFGTTPQYGVDHCPWFLNADDEAMPSYWNEEALFSFLHTRLRVMRKRCNRKWITCETEKSLFCEIVYQRMAAGRREEPFIQELLGLPLSPYMKTPLKLSVAHRVHGYQMKTGWPLDPKSIDDRNAKESNILIETWSTNAAKSNYDESYYPIIIANAANYKLPKEFYDPTRTAAVPVGTSSTSAHVAFDADDEDQDLDGFADDGDDLLVSVENELEQADKQRANDDSDDDDDE